jgi:type II secretory pathway pseudopilin PulG
MLVVLGVFSMTVMLTSSIFLLSNQAQRRVLAASAAQADLRFALEAIVREVRTGRVDFATYEAAGGGVSVPTRRLILRNAADQRLEFFLETSPTVCPPGVPQCLAVSLDGGTAQSLTSLNVAVDDAQFFISPAVDPFAFDSAAGDYKADAQPLVTVMIRTRTIAVKPSEVVRYTAQTSVTSRTYAR